MELVQVGARGESRQGILVPESSDETDRSFPRAQGHESRKDYVHALKAEGKTTGEKQHRELADDTRSSHDGTIVGNGGTGSERPKWAKKHGRNPEKHV